MPNPLPPYVQRVLGRLGHTRPSKTGWDACCPCQLHNAASAHPGDQNPSLGISIGAEGRILLHCRVGCRLDAVLDALGLGVHDLFPGPDDEIAAPLVATVPEKAPGDIVDTAYRVLLEQLTLEHGHRQQLLARGLNDDEIKRRGYRSLRNVDRGRAARAVETQLGDLTQVPGFARGEHGVTLAGAATGIVVPVRGLGGGIVALKIRQDRDPKYVYLSGGEGGASCGSPIHVPLGVAAPVEVVRATEGEVKADVTFALSGEPTIGVPGVTNWQAALPVLRELGARTVVLSFDAPDVREKFPVFEQAEAFHRALVQEGFVVEMEDWDELPEGNR